MAQHWRDVAKPILVAKIEEAINTACEELDIVKDELFPYLGDKSYQIMADAVICVISGIEDAQKFLENDGMLK